VYYFHGDDDFLKEDAVRQVLATAVDPAVRDFNVDVRRGNEVDAESLETMLATPPMMAERRVVVIRDVGALKRDARKVLDRYLDRPAPDTVVVLVSPSGTKAEGALERATLGVEFPVLTGDRVPRWIVHHASTVLGSTITPAAAELLQATVGDDLPELAAELDKLASYAHGSEIDESAVTEIVGARRGEMLGDLLDCIAERDAPAALGLIAHVLSNPKTSAVSIVIALTTQTLAIGWGRAARDRGASAGSVERDYYTLLKETGAYVMRPWNEAVRTWARVLDRWTTLAVDRALDALLDADRALKESRVSSDEQILASLVLALCTDPRAAAA
jgi:DNA polymerase-3 subunit delta